MGSYYFVQCTYMQNARMYTMSMMWTTVAWFSCALSRLTLTLVQKKSTNEPTPVFFYKLDVAVSLTSVVVNIITVLG